MYRNAPIHPFLRFIYLWLRVTTWFSVNVFYRRRIIVGRENLKFDGPAIIVVNHPSTLMDVLNSCLHIRQEPFFLANYSLFKNPVMNWVLTRVFCIPVKRREDVAAGEERNNDLAFEQSFQHLEKNGLLFIAAEGVSWMERWVRPFKTGAARIALGAENRQNWALGVKIIPVGLSYSAPNLFRSDVIVHFGPAIPVSPWALANAQDHEKAIEDFTLDLQQQVRALVLDTRDAAGQAFIEQLEVIQGDLFVEKEADYFAFRKNLIENNIDNEELRLKTADYFAVLDKARVTDEGLEQINSRGDIVRTIGDALRLIVDFPFFLLGYAFWWLPCYLPGLLAKKMKLYIGYDSNVKMLAGLITFPLALWGAFRAALFFGGDRWAAIGVLFGLVLLGYFAEWYLDMLKRMQRKWAAGKLQRRDPELFASLLAKRAAIQELMQQSRSN